VLALDDPILQIVPLKLHSFVKILKPGGHY